MEIKTNSAIGKISDFIKPYIGHLFPGCIVGCASSYGKYTFAMGTQDGSIPVKESDIFDTASVTKAFLNTLALKLIPQYELDQRVGEIIEMKGRYRDQITVRHLITFGAEFGDHVKLSQIKNRGELIYMIRNGDLVIPPGSTYRYTNVSSMLLTFFLHQKFGPTFEDLLEKELLNPLGILETWFSPRHYCDEFRIIPTEKSIPRGTVQDESARLIDEPVGSAGLFSTINDLLVFAQSFLGDSTYLPKEIIKKMHISQFENAAVSFGFGMGLRHQNECDLCNEDGSPIIVLKKNGFSGVHFCVLPENDFCFVVFGNLCYHKRPNGEVRDQFSLFHKKLLRLLYENRAELL